MKKVTLIAMFTSIALWLQGCQIVPLVGAVSAVSVGATSIVTDSRSTGAQIDDSTLYTRVNNKLRSYKRYFSDARIVLTTYNGNVLLTGQANSSQILKVEQIIRQIDGVHGVINQITNGQPIPAYIIANDAWITAKIKSQLITAEGKQALQIKIVTEDGNVFLLGSVSRSFGSKAAEITSKVYGVTHVNTLYNYTD